jgi:hypothetical protein
MSAALWERSFSSSRNEHVNGATDVVVPDRAVPRPADFDDVVKLVADKTIAAGHLHPDAEFRTPGRARRVVQISELVFGAAKPE